MSHTPTPSLLTPREIQALRLIASDLPNKTVAERMGVGLRTAEKHRQNIMRKLRINSVVRLTHFALAHGIVPNLFKCQT